MGIRSRNAVHKFGQDILGGQGILSLEIATFKDAMTLIIEEVDMVIVTSQLAMLQESIPKNSRLLGLPLSGEGLLKAGRLKNQYCDILSAIKQAAQRINHEETLEKINNLEREYPDYVLG